MRCQAFGVESMLRAILQASERIGGREINSGSCADKSVNSFSRKAAGILAFLPAKLDAEMFVPGITGGGRGTGRAFSIFGFVNPLKFRSGPSNSGTEVRTD